DRDAAGQERDEGGEVGPQVGGAAGTRVGRGAAAGTGAGGDAAGVAAGLSIEKAAGQARYLPGSGELRTASIRPTENLNCVRMGASAPCFPLANRGLTPPLAHSV